MLCPADFNCVAAAHSVPRISFSVNLPDFDTGLKQMRDWTTMASASASGANLGSGNPALAQGASTAATLHSELLRIGMGGVHDKCVVARVALECMVGAARLSGRR